MGTLRTGTGPGRRIMVKSVTGRCRRERAGRLGQGRPARNVTSQTEAVNSPGIGSRHSVTRITGVSMGLDCRLNRSITGKE